MSQTILSIDKLSLLCQQNTGNLTEMKEMERELRKVECQQQLSTELLEVVDCKCICWIYLFCLDKRF